MGGLNQAERYFAADCALLFATSLAAIVVTFGLMWLARRRGDPARLCLLHVKIAAVFFILYGSPRSLPVALHHRLPIPAAALSDVVANALCD